MTPLEKPCFRIFEVKSIKTPQYVGLLLAWPSAASFVPEANGKINLFLFIQFLLISATLSPRDMTVFPVKCSYWGSCCCWISINLHLGHLEIMRWAMITACISWIFSPIKLKPLLLKGGKRLLLWRLNSLQHVWEIILADQISIFYFWCVNIYSIQECFLDLRTHITHISKLTLKCSTSKLTTHPAPIHVIRAREQCSRW